MFPAEAQRPKSLRSTSFPRQILPAACSQLRIACCDARGSTRSPSLATHPKTPSTPTHQHLQTTVLGTGRTPTHPRVLPLPKLRAQMDQPADSEITLETARLS